MKTDLCEILAFLYSLFFFRGGEGWLGRGEGLFICTFIRIYVDVYVVGGTELRNLLSRAKLVFYPLKQGLPRGKKQFAACLLILLL